MTDAFDSDRAGNAASRFRSLGATRLPSFDRVTSVAVVAVDLATAKMLAVNLADRGLDIPGGHRHTDDRSPVATARRECMEEACVELGDLWLVDVVESDFYGSDLEDLTYMLIYGAFIKALQRFVPSSESLGRELLRPSEFLARYEAGDKEMVAQWVHDAFQRAEATWS